MLIAAESKNINNLNKLSWDCYIFIWLETSCMCTTVLVRMCKATAEVCNSWSISERY